MKRICLKDICKKESSNIAKKDLAGHDGIYPIYGASGFIKNVDFYQQEKPYISVVKDGAGVGRVMKLPAKSSVIGTMQYIIPDEGIDVSYLAFALDHMNLAKYYTGATIPHIYFKDYCNEQLPGHSFNEQKYIAAFLDKVSCLISLREQQLAKLDELVKSRFIEMFGSIHDNKFGYSICTLQDVCEPIRDGTHQTPKYTDDTVNGYKFLSSKDVTTGKIDWEHLKYIPPSLHEQLHAQIAPKRGDILLAKNGTTGIAAIVDRDEIFDIYVSLALLRPRDVHSAYLWAAINAYETKEQFNASLKGIGVPNLHLGEIKKTRIIVPPQEKQEQFAAFVKQTEKSKLMIQQSLDKLELLKKALMQKYFG